MKQRILLFVMGCMAAAASMAQTDELDSMLHAARTATRTGTLQDTGLARLHTRLAARLAKLGENDSARLHAGTAIAMLAPFTGTNGQDRTVHQLLAVANRLAGRVDYFESRYAESLEHMQAADRHAVAARDTLEQGRSLMHMGFCFREMNDATQAIIYTRRAIAALSRISAPSDLGTAIMSLGGIYSNVSMLDSALLQYHRSLVVFRRVDSRSQMAAALLNIAELYNNNGQHDSAHHYLDEAAPYAPALNPQSQLRYRGMVGRSLVMRAQFREGLAALEEAERAADGNPSDLSVLLHVKALAYAGLKEMPAAMAALRGGDDAMVEDLDLEKVQEVTALRMRYEQEREAALAQERIQEERSRRKLAYSTAALLGVTATLLVILLWMRSRAARELRKKNEEIQRAQERLVISEKAREAEEVRTRIARDVHDQLGSDLTKLVLLSTEAKAMAQNDIVGLPGITDHIERIAAEANRSLGDIVWAIDPHHDSLAGLTERVRAHAERMLKWSRTDHTIECVHTGPDRSLDPATKRDIYLILREALNNAIKYAKADHIHVTFRTDAVSVHMEVKDDGVGLQDKGEGNGLRNMRERAKQIGGSFRLESVQGTTVSLDLPLPG